MKEIRNLCSSLVLIVYLFSPPSAQASGYDLMLTYGSKYNALAGCHTAVVDDAYSVFYNPAGLIQIKHANLVAGATPLIFRYSAPLMQNNQIVDSDINLGPLFFFGGGYRMSDWLALGAAVYPTALQGGTYSNFNYGNAHPTSKTFSLSIARIEVALALAARIIDHVAVGASYRAGYTSIDKEMGVPNALYIKQSYDSWNFWNGAGLKFGLLAYSIGGLSAGVTYRPEVDLTLSGTTDITSLPAPAATDLPTTAKARLPEQVQFGLKYVFIPNKLFASFEYEHTWNKVVIADESTTPAGSLSSPLQWKNAHTLHAGLGYNPRPEWFLGAGTALDFPYTRPENANPVISPAGYNWALTMGSQYTWLDHHTFGAAIGYGRNAEETKDQNPAALFARKGEYSLDVLFINVDYSLSF